MDTLPSDNLAGESAAAVTASAVAATKIRLALRIAPVLSCSCTATPRSTYPIELELCLMSFATPSLPVTRRPIGQLGRLLRPSCHSGAVLERYSAKANVVALPS